MLPMSEELQLRAKKPDYGVSLDDLGFPALKYLRLFGDQCAQSNELVLTIQRRGVAS